VPCVSVIALRPTARVVTVFCSWVSMERHTPQVEITRRLSTLVNSRQDLVIANARFVGSHEFCALEGISTRVLAQVHHLTQTVSLTEQEQTLVRGITAAVATLSP